MSTRSSRARRAAVMAVTLAAVLVLGACGGETSKSERKTDEGPFTIGVVTSLTGNYQFLGPSTLHLKHWFPALGRLRGRTIDSLSGGEQQMVAIARAIASRPSVLLLDEPSLGLAPKVVDSIFSALRSRLHTMAVVLVEQNVAVGLGHADAAVVLAEGKVVRSGSASDLAADDSLREAYLALDS